MITGNASLLWVLKFLIQTVHKDKNIQVILHGGLAAFGSRGSLNPYICIQGIRPALRMLSHKRIQYIVLEETILESVLKELPSLRDFIDVLDHPTPLGKRSHL